MSLKVRSKLLATLVAVFCVTPVTSFAAITGGKIGIINMQKIILNVEDGKTARSDLEKEIKAKEAEFLKQKAELDKLNQEWQNQSALLSEEARLKKQQDFQKKFLELRNAEMGFQNEIKQKEQRVTQEIAGKAAGLARNLAEKQKLEVVFEANSAGLVWVNKPVDLTDDVISLYGKTEGKKDQSEGKKVSRK